MSSGTVEVIVPALEGAPAVSGAVGASAKPRRLVAEIPDWVVDTTLLIAATAAIAALSQDRLATTVLWSSGFGIAVIVSLSNRGLYRPWIASRLLETTRAVVASTVVAAAALIAIRALAGGSTASAREGLSLWIVATPLLVGARSFQGLAALHRVRAGDRRTPTLIVGAGEVGHVVARRLRTSPEFGLWPVGFVDKEPIDGDHVGDGLPVLGASWDLDEIVARHRIRHVIFAFSTAPTAIVLRLLERCEQLGLSISYVPPFVDRTSERFTLDRLGGLPLISPWATNPRGWGFRAKSVLDCIGASIVVVLLSPLLGFLALAVLLTSGRPVLYRQERVGRDGRRFQMLKFRSMKASPAHSSGPSAVTLAPDTAPGGVEGDDRRTPFGIFMRRTSLDELPQLFNVLMGEMSFVGPRPERPEFTEIFDESVHRYGRRLRVKSGITGWAQVNGLRGKTSIADRVECDNYYIENWSFWLDLKILLLTVIAVARPGNLE